MTVTTTHCWSKGNKFFVIVSCVITVFTLLQFCYTAPHCWVVCPFLCDSFSRFYFVLTFTTSQPSAGYQFVVSSATATRWMLCHFIIFRPVDIGTVRQFAFTVWHGHSPLETQLLYRTPMPWCVVNLLSVVKILHNTQKQNVVVCIIVVGQ